MYPRRAAPPVQPGLVLYGASFGASAADIAVTLVG
jgi:hypothetical protein